MKNQLLLFFCLLAIGVTAQQPNGSHFSFTPAEFEKTECISASERQAVRQTISENKKQILKKNPTAFQQRGGSPLFIQPIRANPSFDDYGYFIINNQVDHDLTPNGSLLDYDCNERTYDWATGNHEGTDYVLWPYPWKRMQEEVMQVIAAAPGIIIEKRDGNFDLNCQNNGNPNWNGIIIEHPDGSQAWYWHFKDGAITAKNIGDTVEVGEYLGAAGSSGSSTIPHLHFEVYDANGNLIDPYEGPCNDMNPSSWWADQPDYFVPEINRLSTHNSSNFDTECGVVENTYEELNFEPGEDVIFHIYYRDISTDDNTHITVTKPDGSILYDYDFTSPWPNYTGVYAEWVFPVDATWPDGVYTITAEFYGTTYETIFGVNTNLGTEEEELQELSIYPNPTSGIVFFESNSVIEKIEIYDMLGRKVLQQFSAERKLEINTETWSSGLYLAFITSEGKTVSRKIVKK
ncbi:T9SS type A sorting domain-containing protein [Marixanthomonas ophiurae]|uniref:T9SS C-terminal target domain-containing protein n=1 Tax=Marixanthomonas ophiurae TaxID=387659 RepID=A0A3E1QBN8_9FLAO|nr:T9SS type A sorting domain-containing protein [Marixanthomonas ophiurae]RFN59552.1 T9SS C-terminal target domain-containing protein [Marixanthomonas ophiurae]